VRRSLWSPLYDSHLLSLTNVSAITFRALFPLFFSRVAEFLALASCLLERRDACTVTGSYTVRNPESVFGGLRSALEAVRWPLKRNGSFHLLLFNFLLFI
jgi:hypothetical protein